eukprot:m.182517 g.182517  ORF g.182517 m.182517 type:complete len:828 (-) comp15553_c0_seq1:70-2553(-)
MLFEARPDPIHCMDPEIRAALCALTDSTLGSGGRLEAGHAALEEENANHITNTRWATLSEFALDVTSDTDGSDTTEEARKRLQQLLHDGEALEADFAKEVEECDAVLAISAGLTDSANQKATTSTHGSDHHPQTNSNEGATDSNGTAKTHVEPTTSTPGFTLPLNDPAFEAALAAAREQEAAERAEAQRQEDEEDSLLRRATGGAAQVAAGLVAAASVSGPIEATVVAPGIAPERVAAAQARASQRAVAEACAAHEREAENHIKQTEQEYQARQERMSRRAAEESARLEACKAAEATAARERAQRKQAAAIVLQAHWRGVCGRRVATAAAKRRREIEAQRQRVAEARARDEERRRLEHERQEREHEALLAEEARLEQERLEAEAIRQREEALEAERQERARQEAAEAKRQAAEAAARREAEEAAAEQARLEALRRQREAEERERIQREAARIREEQARRAAEEEAAARAQAELEAALLEREAQTLAATTIQRTWRAYWNRTVIGPALDMAATVIQATWRGYWLRKRMGLLRADAAFHDPDDFEYNEVDLAEFDVDDDLETDPLTATPIGRMVGQMEGANVDDYGAGTLPASMQPSLLGGPRRVGWGDGNTTTTTTAHTTHTTHATMSTTAATTSTHGVDRHWHGSSTDSDGLRQSAEPPRRSRVSQRVQEDWGFKDPRTAAMMVKRAKRMSGQRKAKPSRHSCPNRKSLMERTQSPTTRVEATAAAPASFHWDHGRPMLHQDVHEHLDRERRASDANRGVVGSASGTPPLPPISPSRRKQSSTWATTVAPTLRRTSSTVVAPMRGRRMTDPRLVLPPIHTPEEPGAR